MRKTHGIHQVDGSSISILCNALCVWLQSLPLVTLLFTLLNHWDRMLLEVVIETVLVWPVEER
jgi:hypothetical protein